MKKVAIIMGSDSDLPVLRKTIDVLKGLDIPYECHIYSAHRSPEQARMFALNARKNGFGVIIAAAGMAAHLAGSIAANTTLPVIGIPCKGPCLDGMDALLSTVMMQSTVEPTPHCWLHRFFLLKATISVPSSMRCAWKRQKRHWKKIRLSRKSFVNKKDSSILLLLRKRDLL